MSRHLTPQRRAAEKQFLRTLITTGQHLGKKAPEPLNRSAATRVLRRLRLLSGML
jgi:hypothetical protein